MFSRERACSLCHLECEIWIDRQTEDERRLSCQLNVHVLLYLPKINAKRSAPASRRLSSQQEKYTALYMIMKPSLLCVRKKKNTPTQQLHIYLSHLRKLTLSFFVLISAFEIKSESVFLCVPTWNSDGVWYFSHLLFPFLSCLYSLVPVAHPASLSLTHTYRWWALYCAPYCLYPKLPALPLLALAGKQQQSDSEACSKN